MLQPIHLLLAVSIATIVCNGSTDAAQFTPRSSGNQNNARQTDAGTTNRSIELKVLVDSRAPLGTSQRWMQMLAEVGADRVVASTSRANKPSFEEYGSGSTKTLSVTGIVKNDKLLLPGGKFSIRQAAAIKSHLQKLRDDGAEITVAEKVSFGLTAVQMIDVLERMSAKIEAPTRGKDTATTIRSLLSRSGFPVDIESDADTLLAKADTPFQNELKDFTIGTGLAVALRSIGLVFEPHRPQGQNIRLLVRVADAKRKNWPIGWPITESIQKVAPKIYVKIDLQVQDTPIMDLLNAIEPRLQIPFFYDYHKIGLKQIDLSETKVNFVKNRATYDSVIDKVLNQCKPKMKSKLLIDEEGKIFMWITPRN